MSGAELVLGAVGLVSLVYPAISSLHSKVWKDIGEIREANQDATDPEVFRELHKELATWDQLLQSINKVEARSDGQIFGEAESYCEEYKNSLLKTSKCLERFRCTKDRREMAQILMDLRQLKKSVQHHRKKVEGWIVRVNTVIVSLTHETINRHDQRYSEAFDVQGHKLENIQQRLQGIEAQLTRILWNREVMRESANPATELAAIADDLRTICSQQMAESVVSRTTRINASGNFHEDASEAGDRDSLEVGSVEVRRHTSPNTISQGTQTTLSYSNHSAMADVTRSSSTPTSLGSLSEDGYEDESAWESDSGNEPFSEAESNSSSTIDHLDEGMEVVDRTQPEEGDLDQYAASNAVLEKLQSSIAKECSQIVAGCFGQATRGGPEVLAMAPAEWSEGVGERLWSSKTHTVGVAFERDWRPFQSDPGLATLSNACKLHHMVRRVSFLTRQPTTLDFHDLRQGVVRGGTGGFFTWNMAESCTYDECEKSLDLLCAESLIRVGEDSSMWESTVFCITVPWRLYRFWTCVRERSGVGCLVDQGLLAEIPVKITGGEGQTWQRLWCPETVQGFGLSKEIRAMFHEFSLPRRCGSYMLPRRFIVAVYKTGTADEWVRSVHTSLNMGPITRMHHLGSDGEFDPPIHSRNTGP